MKQRPIYTVQDALDVINAAGISEATWGFPGTVSSFAIFLWNRAQALSPDDIPGRLDDFVHERFPELPAPTAQAA